MSIALIISIISVDRISSQEYPEIKPPRQPPITPNKRERFELEPKPPIKPIVPPRIIRVICLRYSKCIEVVFIMKKDAVDINTPISIAIIPNFNDFLNNASGMLMYNPIKGGNIHTSHSCGTIGKRTNPAIIADTIDTIIFQKNRLPISCIGSSA